MKIYFKLIFAASMWAVASFCQAQIVILTENFEGLGGGIPPGWTKSQSPGAIGWLFGSALGSDFFVIPAHTDYAVSNDDSGNYDASNDRLITPILNLATDYDSSVVKLTFAYVQPGDYGSIGTVEVSINGGSSWIELAIVPSVIGAWATTTVDLSAVAASDNVTISFLHNDNSGWGDGFAIDDVLVFVPAHTDASLDSVTAPEFTLPGPLSIGGSITNRGTEVINSVQVNYRIDAGPVQSSLHNGLNLIKSDSFNFTHAVPINLNTPNLHQVEMWISHVNGAADSNSSNDQLYDQISVLSSLPEKKVVMEVYTGAWCGWCPDAFPILDDLLESYSRVIPVVIHNGDAMEFPDGDALSLTYVSAYPNGTIDRFKFADQPRVAMSRAIWKEKVRERLEDVVPLSVEVVEHSFNPSTREINVTVEARFVGTTSGDMRFNALVVENPVVGSGSGYDQTNYLDGTVDHPYFGAGDPIVNFEHAYTLRAMLGGTWGTQGSIPVTVNSGQTYTKIYTYTLPPQFNADRVSLIGYVNRYNADINEREILNADRVFLIPPIIDASLDSVTTPEFTLPGPLSIGGSITNRGAAVINSFQVNYRIDAGPVQSSLHNGLNLIDSDNYDFTHVIPIDLNTAGLYQVDMWISQVNGAADSNSSNDQLYDQISVLSSLPEKKVVMEVYTGAWCGFCPDAFSRLEDLLANNPRVIPIVLHNSDAMAFPDGDALIATYSSAYPTGSVDRFKFTDEPNVAISRAIWTDKVTGRLADVVPLSVEVIVDSYNPLSREIVVRVEAHFVGTASGDFRFNALIAENPVVGSGSGYDQTNYLDGTVGHPYFGAGDPIVNFQHPHTIRAMLGGTWGSQGSIPATTNSGETYTKTYIYTLPPGFNDRRVSIIGYVSKFDADINQREILNADRVHLILDIFKGGFETVD